MALPFAVIAVLVAVLDLPSGLLREHRSRRPGHHRRRRRASLVRARVLGPVRMVVLGERASIVHVATRWAGHRRAKVVGGVAVDDDPAAPGRRRRAGPRRWSPTGPS
ncbi:MAG: hypothetical protein R2734_14615 [Nocardioides sp.]